jgi:hypothetical protein
MRILINFAALEIIMKTFVNTLLYAAIIALMTCCAGSLKYKNNNKHNATKSSATTEVRVIDTLKVTAAAVARPPAIVFTDTVRNLTIVHGNIMPITFSFHNAGDSMLIISNVEPSCDCMTASASKKNIAQGENAEINISYDPKDESGSLWREVYVTTNARKPPYTLTLNIFIDSWK